MRFRDKNLPLSFMQNRMESHGNTFLKKHIYTLYVNDINLWYGKKAYDKT